MLTEIPSHRITSMIEKWAKRFGINLDRDPEQIS